jgi:hypothetical protein
MTLQWHVVNDDFTDRTEVASAYPNGKPEPWVWPVADYRITAGKGVCVAMCHAAEYDRAIGEFQTIALARQACEAHYANNFQETA